MIDCGGDVDKEGESGIGVRATQGRSDKENDKCYDDLNEDFGKALLDDLTLRC